MIGSQIKANADTWSEFSSGQFAFAPFSLMGGLGQAARVFGGLDALEALLVSLNAAIFKEPVLGVRAQETTPEYRGDVTLP
jgi:type I restriction enzyme R subunit